MKRDPEPFTPFVNFTTEPKTGKTIAYCVRCRQPYRDWNAADHIALCPDCRPKNPKTT